ncbi:MAG: C-GCAxxG-C-C family protein [Candidatus Marinimicrobia bacterium]|nr:C-GCAxxG-C-C family protein [Candidatus Neomarinimicrobiota bacterium]
MIRSEIAINKFKQGYNCAQSVLYSFSKLLDISGDMALKLANGFGAGMGRKQKVCGAISGGILVLNLYYGRDNQYNNDQDFIYAKVKELMDSFEKQYNTVICAELLEGCNLLTQEGQEIFEENNMIEQCYEDVDTTVKILESIIKKQET